MLRVSDIIWHLSLCLTSLSIISSCIHVAANGIICYLLWLILHCLCVPYFVYPCLCCWTFRMLPRLSHWKWYCHGHRGECIILNYSSIWVYAEECDCGSYGNSSLKTRLLILEWTLTMFDVTQLNFPLSLGMHYQLKGKDSISLRQSPRKFHVLFHLFN